MEKKLSSENRVTAIPGIATDTQQAHQISPRPPTVERQIISPPGSQITIERCLPVVIISRSTPPSKEGVLGFWRLLRTSFSAQIMPAGVFSRVLFVL